ncbi:MAG: hypothetical protein HOP19_20545 [Acidobacteria bacterium]|nr:hypothetical protein [Acidobacteriota bacterium]
MQTVLENVLDNEPIMQSERIWTASELRKLPAAERDAILSAAAALAEADYRNDPELTAFETFGEGDLYGFSSSTTTR